MVVLTIMAAMAAMSVPCFHRAIKQSRADVAAANLRAVWAAQRLFWLENHAYTNSLANLRSLGLLDPEYTATGGYTYSVALTASGFTATAENSQDSVTLTIDENGTVQSAGITLGFQ
jgi:Tfp pilus assembly protein PilE